MWWFSPLEFCTYVLLRWCMHVSIHRPDQGVQLKTLCLHMHTSAPHIQKHTCTIPCNHHMGNCCCARVTFISKTLVGMSENSWDSYFRFTKQINLSQSKILIYCSKCMLISDLLTSFSFLFAGMPDGDSKWRNLQRYLCSVFPSGW